MWVILGTILLLFIEFRPRIDYIKESGLVICHYNYKQTRKYFILWQI